MASKWKRMYYYETTDFNEYRCPVCHRPLRVGREVHEDPAPEETRARDNKKIGYLMCPDEACRTMLYLLYGPNPDSGID